MKLQDCLKSLCKVKKLVLKKFLIIQNLKRKNSFGYIAEERHARLRQFPRYIASGKSPHGEMHMPFVYKFRNLQTPPQPLKIW